MEKRNRSTLHSVTDLCAESEELHDIIEFIYARTFWEGFLPGVFPKSGSAIHQRINSYRE